MTVSISELKPYPWNSDVYGTDSTDDQKAEMQDLVQDISQNGVLVRPIVDQNNYIIAGNRRVRACTILGLDNIEVDQYEFSDEMQRIMYLISSNKYRTKTVEMKTREAIYMKTAYKKYAESKKREKTDPEYLFDDDAFRILVGKDALAQCVGMADRTLRKATNVVNEIDRLEEEGETEKAETLRDALETNISGAERMIKDDDEKPKQKPSTEPDPSAYDEDLYWYWKDLKDLILKMRTVSKRLQSSPRHNHTTPTAVVWLISNLATVAEKLTTWAPDNLSECSKCQGSGSAPDGSKCPHCINGLTGYYQVPETPKEVLNGKDSEGCTERNGLDPGQDIDERSGEDRDEGED